MSDNILGVKSNIYHNCDHHRDVEKGILHIPYNIHLEWLYIMDIMGNKEWGAVFSVKDNVIVDYKVPKQEVTSVSVTFKEELGCSGMVHSHHTLGLKDFSSQDDRQARNLYQTSLIIYAGGYTGCEKYKLPCGGVGYRPLEIYITGIPDIVDGHTKKISEEVSKPCVGIYSKYDDYGDYGVGLFADNDKDKDKGETAGKPKYEGDDDWRREYELGIYDDDDALWTPYGNCQKCSAPLHEGFNYCSACGEVIDPHWCG